MMLKESIHGVIRQEMPEALNCSEKTMAEAVQILANQKEWFM